MQFRVRNCICSPQKYFHVSTSKCNLEKTCIFKLKLTQQLLFDFCVWDTLRQQYLDDLREEVVNRSGPLFNKRCLADNTECDEDEEAETQTNKGKESGADTGKAGNPPKGKHQE